MLPVALYDDLIPHIQRIPGMTMTKAIREALAAYAKDAEAEEHRCLLQSGDVFVKAALQPFPLREGRITTCKACGEVHEHVVLPDPTLKGRLFGRVGCLGCHKLTGAVGEAAAQRFRWVDPKNFKGAR